MRIYRPLRPLTIIYKTLLYSFSLLYTTSCSQQELYTLRFRQNLYYSFESSLKSLRTLIGLKIILGIRKVLLVLYKYKVRGIGQKDNARFLYTKIFLSKFKYKLKYDIIEPALQVLNRYNYYILVVQAQKSFRSVYSIKTLVIVRNIAVASLLSLPLLLGRCRLYSP